MLVESKLFDPTDIELPYNIVAIMIWATVEVNLAIVSGTYFEKSEHHPVCRIPQNVKQRITHTHSLACLPMMRPIFKRMKFGSALDSDPSKYGNASRGTGGPGIKLNTITTITGRHMDAKEDSETSSTRQLAEDVERGSNHSNEYDRSGSGLGASVQGPQTFISGRSLEPATPTTQKMRDNQGMRGIHVKNEMSVSYESA